MTGHREELAARALRLRTGGEGMSVPAIARELGISAKYAYDLIADPSGERHRANRRAWDRAKRTTPCQQCGEPAYGRLCWLCAGHAEPMQPDERRRASKRGREVYDRDPDHPFKCGREGRPVPPKPPPPPPEPKPPKPPKPKREPIAKRRQRDAEPRRRRIQALWIAGYSPEEIAERIGATPAAVGVQVCRMRQAGWDMPYRRHGKGAAT